jgi:selenocysteine lyase/cysteine desulfurase
MLSAAHALDDADYFAELRAREFDRLDVQGLAYLDYTGSALYASSQVRAHLALLDTHVFGNPHSDSTPSRMSTIAIETVRRRVLEFFDVDETTHDVVFTANTSAAIKLVAESYPFSPLTTFALSADNHNSVNGIREYALRARARIVTLPLDEELRLDDPRAALADGGPGLLAYPAQSNFSGVRHPLSLISRAQELGFDVLLDAAAYVPSHALSLRSFPADFAAVSFYKLFGYPTGVGALIARHSALERLRRPWFAGGTVLHASVAAGTHRLRARYEGFEDGTPNFLGIAALESGFDLLDEVGLRRLSDHVRSLGALFLKGIREMPGVQIHGPATMTDRGATFAFSLSGAPYWDVESRAREAGVALRGGCFCNPGAAERAFNLDRETIERCTDALGDSFTPAAFAACASRPVGAVRASLGLANNERDVERTLEVIRRIAASPSLSSRA